MTNRGPAGIAAFLLLRKMGPEILDHPEFKDFKELNESILVDAAEKMQENVAKYEPPKPEVKIEKSGDELSDKHKKIGRKFVDSLRRKVVYKEGPNKTRIAATIIANRQQGSERVNFLSEILSKTGGIDDDEQGKGGIS